MAKADRKVDVQALRELYASNAVAQAMFDHFAARQKNSETKTERMLAILQQDGRRVSRADVIAVFRKLESAGCGSYVEGRHRHPSRFVWMVNLSDVGRAANGSVAAVSALPTSTSKVDDEDTLLPHDFRLRPGLVLRFDLPSDLTVGEAGRIADYVRTLPFA